MIKEKILKLMIEKVVGGFTNWEMDPTYVRFRTTSAITLKTVIALSEALGTDAINFNMGTSGEPAYSEVTPGTDGMPGFIEIRRPIPGPRPEPEPEPRVPGPVRLTLDLEDG